MSISRRNFLETAAAGGMVAKKAASAEGARLTLPTRTLGRTGAKVSILAMGAGSRFLAYHDEDKALEAMNRAVDLGVDIAHEIGLEIQVLHERKRVVSLSVLRVAQEGFHRVVTPQSPAERIAIERIALVVAQQRHRLEIPVDRIAGE